MLFGGLIHVKGGKIVATEIWYECDSRSGRRTVYDVRETLLDTSLPEFRRYRWKSPGYGIATLKVDPEGVPWDLEILLTNGATDTERMRAYSVDFACLGKIYGCHTPPAVVPSEILSDAANAD